MARGVAARCLLSSLHVCAGLAAGGSMVAVLMQWAQDLNCVPPIADSFGDPVNVHSALGYACDLITYSSGVVAALCLLMAVSINCCWGSWGCWLLHQLVTLLMCVMCTGCAAALTMDFVLWCHSLQDSVKQFDGCSSAAHMYDEEHKTSNMTAYFRKLELQQACQWAAVPFLLCAVVVYSIVMKTSAHRRSPSLTGGRYYLLPDESAPLIAANTSLESVAGGTGACVVNSANGNVGGAQRTGSFLGSPAQ